MLGVRGKRGFSCPVALFGECSCQQCGVCLGREERISFTHYKEKMNFEAKGIPITLTLSLPSDESKIYIGAHQNAHAKDLKLRRRWE